MIGTGTKAVAVTLGAGAILAIVNALGMSLGARRRQLAIMRAIGFGGMPLAIALLLEVWVIAMVCAGVVILLGWLLVNDHEVGSSVMGTAVQFQLHVSRGVILRTVVYLLLLGTISAVGPIWSAVRAQMTHALQNQ